PCGRDYPVILGIPDFRVFHDPYIDYVADRRKGLRIAERAPAVDFPGLVEYYWSITPGVPADLVRRYVRNAVTGEGRGRRLLGSVEAALPRLAGRAGVLGLELGCGTGGFLAAAGRRWRVVGTDIAFRWLVVARKRLEELGVSAPLVCCCAEHLPFAAGRFDCVVAANVFEHAASPGRLLREAHRTLRPGGGLFASTV